MNQDQQNFADILLNQLNLQEELVLRYPRDEHIWDEFLRRNSAFFQFTADYAINQEARNLTLLARNTNIENLAIRTGRITFGILESHSELHFSEPRFSETESFYEFNQNIPIDSEAETEMYTAELINDFTIRIRRQFESVGELTTFNGSINEWGIRN